MIQLALLAGAQTVGFLDRVILAGQSDLMSYPFLHPDDNDVNTLFPGAWTSSTFTIYFWDTNLAIWSAYKRTGGGKGFIPPPARTILPGEAFFLHSTITREFALSGFVPTASTPRPIGNKPVLLAYPYPQDMPWTNVLLFNLLEPGSTVSFWSQASNRWTPTFLKAPLAKGGGWGNTASNYLIPAGNGFAVYPPVDTTNYFSWSE